MDATPLPLPAGEHELLDSCEWLGIFILHLECICVSGSVLFLRFCSNDKS